MASFSQSDSLRRSKRNKFHLDVAAIMSPHSDRRFKSVSPSRKRTGETKESMERMRSRSTIKSVSAVIGKRERKVPVRHLDFISDEHLEPESDDDGPPQKMRGGRGDFYCTHCPAHYPTRTGLANHTKQHGSMKKYRCEECDMSCDSLKTLRVHSQVHIPDDGDQPLISFTQHSNKVIEVEERRQNHHNEVVSVEKSLESKATDAQRGSAGEGSAKKPGCSGAVSSDLSSNIKYRATGTSASKAGHFVCKECPFTTRDIGRLTTHEEGHKRERGFQCPMCTYRSESAGFLRRHCDCHGKDRYPWPPVYVGRHTTTRKGALPYAASTCDLSKRTEMLEPNNVMGKRMVRSSTDVAAYVSSATTSPTVIPLCREVQHTTEKSNFTALLPARTASSLRFKKSSGRTFDNQRRKPSIHHQQRSFKGIAASRMAKYKCFCCHARFFTNYERSAHRSLCRRAPKIAKSLYTALLKERVDAFKRDEKHPFDATSSDRSTPVEQRVHSCAHCPFTCAQKSRLQRHENKHFLKAEHQCTYCSFSCRSVDILIQHSRLHQPSRMTQMPGRPKDFSFTDDVPPGGTSTLGKIEKCSECPYRSRHLCDMKAHAAMHIGMREFPCNRCTYSTKRAHVLEAHLQMHAEEDGLPASSQQGSSDVDAKKRISIRWRGKVIGTRSGSKLTRVYACNFCPFRTRFCAPLFTHSRNHTGHRAMRCTRCTFTTSVSRKLREHCALHPLARSTVSSLSRNTHPDGFFTCRDCPFSCDSYGKLWHHVQKHKRASRFSCDLCTFSTGSSSCLAEHRALHSCSLQSESKMEEIIVVSDSSSVKEYEGFDETDEMEVDEQTSSVDHSMEHETSRAEPVSNTTSLSSSDGGRRQAVEKEEHDDMPVKDSSPSLVNNDEEDPFVSNEMELLMRIRKTHSNLLVPSEKSYRCSECPFISEDKMVLAFHSDRHRAKGGHLKCNMCSYKAHTPEALCSHINLHTKAHPQAAAVASFRKRKPRRSSPESISQNGKLIKCTRCAYQTASADRYTAHCLEHALRIQRRLETSIRRSKSSGGGIEKKQKGYRLARKIDGQQFCWKCSFHCDSESALGTHMELHGLAAPFVCSLCDYGSFSKNVVLFHEMNHHLDVPLTNFCNNSFAAVDQPKSLVLLESSELQSRQQSLRCNRCGSILHNFTEFVTHCNLIHHDNTPNSNLPADDRMEDESNAIFLARPKCEISLSVAPSIGLVYLWRCYAVREISSWSVTLHFSGVVLLWHCIMYFCSSLFLVHYYLIYAIYSTTFLLRLFCSFSLNI